MKRELQMKCVMALIGVVLTGSAVAQDDPMWAPSGADIISVLNKHYVNEVGPLTGRRSAREQLKAFSAGLDGFADPPTPTPERAYDWPGIMWTVLVVVFRTPDEALQCLNNNYARMKPDYDRMPTYRPWPNFPTYVSHSFKMTQFHDHACYRGEGTVKCPEMPSIGHGRSIDPDHMKMWTEQKFIAEGFVVNVYTNYVAAWVRGRTFIVCDTPRDWGEVERLHKLMHALPSAPKPVPPPSQPPTVTNPPWPPIGPPSVVHPPPPPPMPQPSKRYRVFIDGQLMRTQAPPTEVNGRVLVGLADIFRELGASVVWDGAQRRITATRGSRIVQLWIGRTTALVDGSAVTLDVPPLILAGGKTYVPVRFVSQALGAGVTYDSPNRAVMITTASMPPLSGSATTPPYTPPTPPQGTIQISICRETGLKATGLCPNTLTRSFAPNAVPGPCTTHALGPKLIVTSPTNGATVPERFTISGTSVPGRTMRITVIAEATLKATGQNATSPLLENAEAKVGNDGRWSIEVNARAVRRDQRVEVKQFRITVDMRMNRKVVEQVDLVVRP